MNYLQAEHLKHKRAFVRKLLYLFPLITVLISFLAPLWFQINSYNWWYILLCPGLLTLICSLVERRDNDKLKYQAILSLPISLNCVWKSKIGIAAIYYFLGNIIFLCLNLAGGFFFQVTMGLSMTIDVWSAMVGTFCIVLMNLWEIPLCLWLSRRFGMFVAVFLNCGIGSILGVFGGDSYLWLLCPYSWVPHLMIFVLGIMPNGLPVPVENREVSIVMIGITILLSLGLFGGLSLWTAKWFAKRR